MSLSKETDTEFSNYVTFLSYTHFNAIGTILLSKKFYVVNRLIGKQSWIIQPSK